MLYKKNTAEKLSDELFRNPTSEYRGAPFWAWNSRLTKEELCHQIEIFKEMGLGGFHMHVRTGLENEYLSEEFMELVRACVDKAKEEHMLAWLYDEDRWASGAAGGIVTDDEKYRSRYLLFTPYFDVNDYPAESNMMKNERISKEKLLACYDVKLDSEGYLEDYRRISKNEKANGTKWYAFLEIDKPSNWFNGKTYPDTLNIDAIKRFVEVTHEKYKKKVGDEFDGTIPAIFTDEPNFSRKRLLNNSFDKADATTPWTDAFPEKYNETYGEDIFDFLPELFWDLPNCQPSVHRYRYHDFVTELFVTSFADLIGSWCTKNKISLTGHMLYEESLHSQTSAVGEAMRSYRGFGIPGIDQLCNRHEFTTAKQAQSAVHQFGREAMLSELYGVTGWDSDFRLYKHQGDWQACLGVTVRVPHLSWYAMHGEAKRDFPASMHYQSAWYKKFSLLENHFARVNTAMTRGKCCVRVAVIHPIESFWLHWGPNDKSDLLRENLDDNFQNVTKWLIEGSIDFDFICESLLPSLCEKGSNPLKVGAMAYDAVIVPGCETLRASTLERLEEFKKGGGRLIFMGYAPAFCDAEVSERGKGLYDISQKIDFSRASLLSALEESRFLTICRPDGALTNNFIYQLREDNGEYWLFICHNSEPYDKSTDEGADICIILNGTFAPIIYDTETGGVCPCKAKYKNNKTFINRKLFGYDSLLLKLKAGKSVFSEEQKIITPAEPLLIEKTAYTLSEDNVLLLDIARYKLDGEKDFSEKEEILRLDDICRKRAGFVKREGGGIQPWARKKTEATRKITLKFEIDSEIEYSGAFLALEDAETAEIVFNGERVKNEIRGFYVDIAIKKISLPDIKTGENILEVTLPFGENTDVENMFLLGSFGVSVSGCRTKIIPLPEKISFGDLTSQGFPFYGGTITYRFAAENKNKGITISAANYAGALISVDIDGKERGDIVYPPYTLYLPDIEKGKHSVELKLWLHRYNTFGPLHNTNEKNSFHCPGSWRTEGNEWSYEYILRKTGIITSAGIK